MLVIYIIIQVVVLSIIIAGVVWLLTGDASLILGVSKRLGGLLLCAGGAIAIVILIVVIAIKAGETAEKDRTQNEKDDDAGSIHDTQPEPNSETATPKSPLPLNPDGSPNWDYWYDNDNSKIGQKVGIRYMREHAKLPIRKSGVITDITDKDITLDNYSPILHEWVREISLEVNH